tara:strand:- start:1709 stop:2341 length:633 start_codon:yes stop_codon:yes gene_type:complete
MKTGGVNKRQLPETFYIILLGLEAILKRCGFKDAVLFKMHNPSHIMNSDLFASGVCFNLFSKYGVGKELEPLIQELFKKYRIDEHMDNVFFEEIVKLAIEIMPLIREADSIKESDWSYNYAIKNLNQVDGISSERLSRLVPLFIDENNIDENNIDENDIDENDIDENNIDENDDKIILCNCSFCSEFRKYNYPKEEHIDRIIINMLINYW